MTLRHTLKAFVKNLETRSIWIYLFGFLIALFFSVLSLIEPKFLSLINNKIYDSLLTANIPATVSKIPVIVYIDEESLSRYGQWPWPRYRIARLLEKIRDAGPSSILIDVFFAEQDRTSPIVLQRDLKRDLNVEIKLGDVPVHILDNDRILAKTLSKGPFVLGYKFTFTGNKQIGPGCNPRPVGTSIIRQSEGEDSSLRKLYEASGIICSLPKLAEKAAGSGFINAKPDNDGILRRVPLVTEYKGGYYPSLVLAAIMTAGKMDNLTLRMSDYGLESVILDDASIPVDPQGNLLIKFPKNNSFTIIPAADVLEGKTGMEQLKDKIVILGVNAGGLGDLYTLPHGALTPGTEVHAALLDNIIRRDYLSRPGWMRGLEAGLTLLIGTIFTFLIAGSGAWRSFIVLAVLSVCIGLGAEWMFTINGFFVSPFIPLLAMASILSLLMLFKYWIKEHEIRESIKQTMLTQDFTILCLSSLIETRDRETGNHTMRCQNYIKSLCRKLSSNHKFSSRLDAAKIEQLSKSAPLHDIGKIGVPDSLLHNPHKLTEEEYDEIKKHAVYGYQAIERAEQLYGKGLDTSFLSTAKAMAISHHEHWDGKGYPYGLSGDNIPFPGRLMAVADVYDALISRRVYKSALTHEQAVAIIAEYRGKYLDPDMADAFLAIHEEFRSIAERFPDI